MTDFTSSFFASALFQILLRIVSFEAYGVLFCILPIISICPVLTEIVLILQLLGSRLDPRIDRLRTVCHLCHFLKHHCIVDCIMRIFSPGKRSVVLAQHCRHRHHVPVHGLEGVQIGRASCRERVCQYV